jgi:hypothetical protein
MPMYPMQQPDRQSTEMVSKRGRSMTHGSFQTTDSGSASKFSLCRSVTLQHQKLLSAQSFAEASFCPNQRSHCLHWILEGFC